MLNTVGHVKTPTVQALALARVINTDIFQFEGLFVMRSVRRFI